MNILQSYGMDGGKVLAHRRRKYRNSLCLMRPPLLTFSSEGDPNDSDWFVRLLLTAMDLGLAPSQGQSEFLSKETVFEQVDDYANKVVNEVFQQLEDGKLQPKSAVKWADAYGIETMPKLCTRDILRHLEGKVESVRMHSVRLCSFRKILPFLPLVDCLIDHRDTIVENDNDGIDESLPIFENNNGDIPPRLRQGLFAFFNKRCPSITIKSSEGSKKVQRVIFLVD